MNESGQQGMLKAIALSALLLAIAGCHAASPDSGNPRQPSVEFDNGDFLINGGHARIGATTKEWISLLGDNYRYANPRSPRMMVWDELGIFIYTDFPKKDSVRTVAFAFNTDLDEGPGTPDATAATRPKRPFPGQVVVSSTRINGDMKISDIPAASNMMLEVHCSKGIATCTTNRVDGTDRGYSIYFTVDEKRYESLPYTIEIGRAL
ncbi:hypothetical protein [uncultured Stenotrophomonas sp.]|uniref:DUF7738 domain-containing protein n=1 Tax=uncultured Stenotrophomonas sp. TaxID=165438 RepID=UPI0025E4EE42|nr:hypothetical protein [uncultured Stenotrophomonas sp.]